MSKIIVVTGAAGHGKSKLLSLLKHSDYHCIAGRLIAPTVSQAQEALKSLKSGETLVIDECASEVLEHIKGTTYDGFVVAALTA